MTKLSKEVYILYGSQTGENLVFYSNFLFYYFFYFRFFMKYELFLNFKTTV